MLDKLKQLFGLKKETGSFAASIEDKIEEAFNTLDEDIIKLEIGGDIAECAEAVCEKINELRDNIKSATGFIFPPVHVLHKEELQENELVLFVRGKEVLRDFLVPNKEIIVKNIYEILNHVFDDYLDEIFTMEYVEKYINKVQMTNSWMVWDISKQLGGYEIKKILVNVIKEKKSIANINWVFEKIDECLSENRDFFHVWDADIVSRYICKEI